MQQASQITEPDYGTLLDDMLFTCTPGQVLDIPAARFIAPRVEVELAFVLKAPLQGPDVTVEQVLAATDYVTPAIEIIDARIEQFDRHTQGDAQGVRHHQRQRRQRRHRASAARKADPHSDQPALVRRHPAPERRGRGNGPRRRRAGPPGHRHRLAGQQARALGRIAASRADRAGRLVHPPGARAGRRPVRGRLRRRSAA